MVTATTAAVGSVKQRPTMLTATLRQAAAAGRVNTIHVDTWQTYRHTEWMWTVPHKFSMCTGCVQCVFALTETAGFKLKLYICLQYLTLTDVLHM